MDKLDIEQANQEMFEPDSKGRLNSLTTVLTQEVDRFNKLLKVIKVRIRGKDTSVKGHYYLYKIHIIHRQSWKKNCESE